MLDIPNFRTYIKVTCFGNFNTKESFYLMRIIALKTLKEFWTDAPDSEEALKAWYAEAEKATWKDPAEVKEKYRSASILKDSRVVFNICGNKYRLIVKINYSFGMVYIRFIGTHKQYDKINAETI